MFGVGRKLIFYYISLCTIRISFFLFYHIQKVLRGSVCTYFQALGLVTLTRSLRTLGSFSRLDLSLPVSNGNYFAPTNHIITAVSSSC